MSARTVAAAIEHLLGEPWMPRVSHWEIATTDDVWGAHAELDCETPGSAFRELHALADKVGSQLVEVSDSLTALDFEYDDVSVRVWWLRPVLRWIVPETCATCPTKLGEPDVPFVRLGDGADRREAPVICVPCRDVMHAAWVSTTCPAADRGAEHHWWFSGPDNGWACTACRTVRTDPADPATMTRAPRVEAGESQ